MLTLFFLRLNCRQRELSRCSSETSKYVVWKPTKKGSIYQDIFMGMKSIKIRSVWHRMASLRLISHAYVKYTFRLSPFSSVESAFSIYLPKRLHHIYWLFHAGLLFNLFFDAEDGDDIFLQKVGWLLTDYKALYCRRHDYRPVARQRPRKKQTSTAVAMQ
jgi:hypothetical protein